MDKEKQIIKECKTLLEQSELFQRKMKAKHSRMKKRVIGHGGQSNTPPYSEKPSMERSKSAPPIGEIRNIVRDELIAYLIQEGLLDKLGKEARKFGFATTLGSSVAATGAVAKGVSDLEAQEQAQIQQNIEQYKPNTQFDEIKKQYDIFMDHEPSSEEDYEIIKNKLIQSYDLNDQQVENIMSVLGFKPWNRNGIGNARTLIDLSALYKMENPNISKKELFDEVVKTMANQKGSKDPKQVAKNLGITSAFGTEVYLYEHFIKRGIQNKI